MKISPDSLDYLIKHNLFDKYFKNYTNFNSNNYSLKECFNTYNNNFKELKDSAGSRAKLNFSPIYRLDNSYSFLAGKYYLK